MTTAVKDHPTKQFAVLTNHR